MQGESLGPAIDLKTGYENFWVYIPHFIHSPFYVYAYAFGDCLVNSLYAVYEKADKGFADRYLDMLAAGGTKHHKELLAPFGLDATDPTVLVHGAQGRRRPDRRARGDGRCPSPSNSRPTLCCTNGKRCYTSRITSMRRAMKIEIKRIGNSDGLILARGVDARLDLKHGQRLHVTELPGGGFQALPCDPDFEKTMEIVDEIIDEYRDTLARSRSDRAEVVHLRTSDCSA